MSKINQIEKALDEIDATKFHKLIDSYLSKKYSYQIQSHGTKLAEDKPIKGTPDSFATLDNGKYVFMEYTTQKTNILNKFLDDLEKCFDEVKTKISINKIEKIILACNSDIKPKDIETLKNKCKENSIDCTVFTNSMISNDLNNNFSIIAKDFLDIEIDTNQILDYDDFIKIYDSSKYSTSLNTSFKFREDEIAKFKNLLDTNNILFITGGAGVGKTKFALEECKKYAHKNQYKFKAILNRGVNLFDDIKAYFQDEKYLILIDDINRVYQALEYIQEYCANKIRDNKIKIVATIRDYAKNTVLEKIPQKIVKEEIALKQFDEKEIKSIIQDEYQITNPIYLDKIVEVSQGNPRLALMSAKVAKETDKLESIYDVTTIYDEYFKTVNKDISIYENNSLLISIVIISFFRVVDKSNAQQMQLIESSFNISSSAFWIEVEKLNNLELVDLYQNEVVKISDQILSMYLFYKIVFIDKKIDIYTILDNFFPQYQKRVIDTLSPLFQTFNSSIIKEELKIPIDKLWTKYKDDEETLLLVMQMFWFLKQIDILIYIDKRIDNIAEQEFELGSLNFWNMGNKDDSDKLLNILSLFSRDKGNIAIAVELIVKYLKKEPLKLSQIFTKLINNYGYQNESYSYGYDKERHLVDVLWKLTNNGKDILITKLFIRISSYLVKTEFEDNLFKGNQYTMLFYKLREIDELQNLRKSIFEKVFSLYQNKEYRYDILKLIEEYPAGLSYRYDISNVELWDSSHILDFINNNLDKESYGECTIVQHFLNALDNKNIKYDKQIRKIFQHKYYDIEKILMLDNISISLENKGSEKTDRQAVDNILIERLRIFFKDYLFEDWKNIFNLCDIIDKSKGRDNYKLTSNLNNLFNILAKNNPQLYIQVITEYLRLGNLMSLDLNILNLVEILGKDEAYKLLNQYDYTHKDSLLFQFFIILPKEQITKNEVDELLSLYKNTKIVLYSNSLNYLENYLLIKPTILIEIINIVLDRSKDEEMNFIGSICDMFNIHSNIFENLKIYFTDNIQLLKNIYLLCLENDKHHNYDNNVLNKILTLDNSFIEEYINYIFNKESHINSYDITSDFSIIWNRDDYKEVIFKLVDTLFNIRQNNVYVGGESLKAFFEYQNNNDIKGKVNSFIKEIIQRYSQNEKYIIFIFELIVEYSDERKKEFIECFLKYNQSFELFDKLSFEPSYFSWEGSRVPTLEKEKEYFESLLDILSSVKLLKHKQKIKEIVQWKKDDIERYKKEDFMSDD
jgi:hypothetical protein